jgi:beta-glucanase (GH16 family)
MRFQQSLLACLLSGLAAANTPPPTLGMRLVWSDDFTGFAGGSPNPDAWNVMDFIDTNNEVQEYSTSNANLQISGGGTVQFIPRKSPEGRWTSGRIETVDSFTPEEGKVMMIAASILIGGNPRANKQGMWPAFWALGDAMRNGVQWPEAGEIDIFEQVSGQAQGYGTVHCGSAQGGPCNEPVGRPVATTMPEDGTFHTWAVRIDRTNADWTAQTITWEQDGNPFYVLHGADIGDLGVWASLAHSPLYVLLNVAVGGNWPGPPNEATMDGYGSMMEVEWVGVWTSS